MNSLQISLRDQRAAFAPGDEIAGVASWSLDREAKSAYIHLCWLTRGKGTEDNAVVETIIFDAPPLRDQRHFSFRAPLQPYSFSGRLISLLWVVELVIEPGRRFERVPIVIGPGRSEVILPSVATK